MSLNNTVSAAISAQNTYSATLGVGSKRKVNFSLYGTFVANVVLQRKPSGAADSAYRTIGTYSAPVEKIIDNVGNWVYRAGVATGGYTSGTANVQLLA